MSTHELLDCSNAAYHANTTHLSSSALKLLLRSPNAYYDKYIAKTTPSEHKAAFDVGSFVHTLLLEPEKVATDYAVFSGLRKAGHAFDAFAAANRGKTILSFPQVARCESMAKAAMAVPFVVDMLAGGISEHTMLSEMLGVPVKARADKINIEGSYIVDVKTTAMPTDVDIFRQTIADYAYDLSAALYCQIAHDNYGKLFDFYFIVLSKADNGVGIYRASSETLSAGAAKVTSALVLYKQCVASGIWDTIQPRTQFANHNIEVLEV